MTPDQRQIILLRIEWLISEKNAAIAEGNMMTQFRDYWQYDVMGLCYEKDREIDQLFNSLEQYEEAKP